MSKIIESLRGDLAALHEAGAIGKVTMREFDAICPPPVREFSAADIKHLRERLKFSQPVFALHLHTTASTVRKWEQGETHPTGPALKLLNVIADNGLQAIIGSRQTGQHFLPQRPKTQLRSSNHVRTMEVTGGREKERVHQPCP